MWIPSNVNNNKNNFFFVLLNVSHTAMPAFPKQMAGEGSRPHHHHPPPQPWRWPPQQAQVSRVTCFPDHFLDGHLLPCSFALADYEESSPATSTPTGQCSFPLVVSIPRDLLSALGKCSEFLGDASEGQKADPQSDEGQCKLFMRGNVWSHCTTTAPPPHTQTQQLPLVMVHFPFLKGIFEYRPQTSSFTHWFLTKCFQIKKKKKKKRRDSCNIWALSVLLVRGRNYLFFFLSLAKFLVPVLFSLPQ